MTLGHCPRCDETVLLPMAASPSAKVCCPLCLEQYELSEALQTLPPRLILVEDDAADSSVSEPAGLAWSSKGPADLDGELALAPMEFERPAPAFDFSGEAGTASRVATGRRAGRGRRPQASPMRSVLSVVLGGLLAFPMAQLILWYLPGDLKRDFGWGPTIAQYVPQIVPAQFHGKTSLTQSNPGAAPQTDADSLIPDFDAAVAAGQQDQSYGRDNEANSKSSKGSRKPSNARGTNEEQQDFGLTTAAAEPAPLTTSEATPAGDGSESAPARPAALDVSGGDTAASVIGKWRTAPPIRAEDFISCLLDARDASAAWDRSTDVPTPEVRQKFYRSLAKLGKVLAASEDQRPLSTQERLNVEKLLRAISQQPDKLALIDQVGAGWLKDPRSAEGVVLSGVVESIERRGSWFVMGLRLPTLPAQAVTVVVEFDSAVQLAPQQRLLLLGAVVDQPAQNLADYPGTERRVVLDAQHIILDQP